MECVQDFLKDLEAKKDLYVTKNKDKEEVKYDCKLCQDTGVIIKDNSFAKQCGCVVKKAREIRVGKLLEFADIPKNFQGLNLSDFKIDVYENNKLANVCKQIAFNYIKYFNQADNGLYFYSEKPGSGKTMMAIIIGNEIMRVHQKAVKYTTVSDLKLSLLANFKNDAVSNKDILDSFSEVDLLILDDIGQEKPNQWAEEQLFTILDKRQDNNRPTIFTSNVKIDDLHYHERIKSRIKKLTEMTVIFPEEDIRVKGSEEEKEFAKLLLEGLGDE